MAGVDGIPCLVASALLTHGLFSLDNEEIKEIWGDCAAQIAYVDYGSVKITGMDEYLVFRNRAANYPRINRDKLADALENGISGALTASGTMAVCFPMGVPVAVTGGMGGIGAIKGEEMCPDLLALADYPITLVASAPKDMLDYAATFGWLHRYNVPIFGVGNSHCDGFMFARREPAILDGLYNGQQVEKGMLLLKGIPLDERLMDENWLEQAVAAGKAEAEKGGYFHPAVNRRLDELSKGESSRSQLRALRANADVARRAGGVR